MAMEQSLTLRGLSMSANSSNASKPWMAVSASGVAVVIVLALIQPPFDPISGTKTVEFTKAQASTNTPSSRSTAPGKDIGPVETKSPPPPSPGLMTGPGAAASTGIAETGPHGTVDVTAPMPTSPPTAPRIEADQPVAPGLQKK